MFLRDVQRANEADIKGFGTNERLDGTDRASRKKFLAGGGDALPHILLGPYNYGTTHLQTYVDRQTGQNSGNSSLNPLSNRTLPSPLEKCTSKRDRHEL